MHCGENSAFSEESWCLHSDRFLISNLLFFSHGIHVRWLEINIQFLRKDTT